MFKIEYEPDYGSKYVIYRKEFKFFGWSYEWKCFGRFETFELAEVALKEAKNYPKYY